MLQSGHMTLPSLLFQLSTLFMDDPLRRYYYYECKYSNVIVSLVATKIVKVVGGKYYLRYLISILANCKNNNFFAIELN